MLTFASAVIPRSKLSKEFVSKRYLKYSLSPSKDLSLTMKPWKSSNSTRTVSSQICLMYSPTPEMVLITTLKPTSKTTAIDSKESSSTTESQKPDITLHTFKLNRNNGIISTIKKSQTLTQRT